MTEPQLSRAERRAISKHLTAQHNKLPASLVRVPEHKWPTPYRPPRIIEVWRSREYLVQVFKEGDGVTRLSVCRAALSSARDSWADGITWDDLQRIKRECGRGHLDAAEAYPADNDVVNVSNMRHLFVFDRPLPWLWRVAA